MSIGKMGQADALAMAESKWGRAPKISRVIPFGYVEDPNDNKVLLPVLFELQTLERGKELLAKGYSLRSVARWITAKTGRSITYEGLRKRVEYDRSAGQRRKALANWIETILTAAKDVRDFDIKFGRDPRWYREFLLRLHEEASRQASEDTDEAGRADTSSGVQAESGSAD